MRVFDRVKELCNNLYSLLFGGDFSVKRQRCLTSATKRKKADITWAVDSTGVGDGVCEIISSKMPLSDIYRVYLKGGINAAIDYNNRQINLPKNQMVSVLLGCFDSDRIFISKRSREYFIHVCGISLVRHFTKLLSRGSESPDGAVLTLFVSYSCDGYWHSICLFGVAK